MNFLRRNIQQREAVTCLDHEKFPDARISLQELMRLQFRSLALLREGTLLHSVLLVR